MTDLTVRVAQWLPGAFDAKLEQIKTMAIPDSAKVTLRNQVEADRVELELKPVSHPVHPIVVADLLRIARRYRDIAGFDAEAWATYAEDDEEPEGLLAVDDRFGRIWSKPEGETGTVWALNTDGSQRCTWAELLAGAGPVRPRTWGTQS
jgi:hypothetical protein